MRTSKLITNLQIAKLLRSVSAALELSAGDNKFRIIAYDRAADAIEHSSSEVKDLWDDGKLKDLAGIGSGIASSLDELFKTGHVKHFASILKPFPPAIFELLNVPGIGPKTALKLCQALGITSVHSAISKLEKAAIKGHIRRIPGFGLESEADILKGLTQYKNISLRLSLNLADSISSQLIAWLIKIPQVKRADPLGSLRRRASTVGDIDISVASDQSHIVINHFLAYPQAVRKIEAGERTASILLPNNIQVDLMVQSSESYGSLLQHFTGSKHHNIALRELAIKQGYSLSEYGIKTPSDQKMFSTEESFYSFLGLDWIPPELREDTGEIQAAKAHHLPKLIELGQIRGDFQIHSSLDVEPSHDLGQSSLAQITAQAQKLGYEYIGLTEHNPSVSNHTQKQVMELIKRKSEIIHNFSSPVFVFNGLEIDIQPDGSRALPDSCLELLDYACVSIHSSFNQSRDQMTKRVLKALDHPKIRFFAHPTARLLGEREGVELDWDKIFAFCLEHHKWLEIDAWPNRLDLPDVLVHSAVKAGVKIIINSDSHQTDHLQYMSYGVSVARRGWATKADIVNSLSLDKMKSLIFERG